MERLLVFAVTVLSAALAFAGPVPLAWDPNPPEEQVTEYCLWSQTPDGAGGWNAPTEEWCGPGTQHTLDLEPGRYRLTATARTMWHSAQFPDESEPSEPVFTPEPVPSQVQSFRGEWVVIQIAVEISEKK